MEINGEAQQKMLPKDTLVFTALPLPIQECDSSFMQDEHKHYWHPDLPWGCKAESCALWCTGGKKMKTFGSIAKKRFSH